MRRSGSIQLARIFGIRIGVSASWFFVLFFFIYVLSGYFQDILGSNTEGYVVAVASALLFFASLVLHELGHAVVARRLGLEIEGVDLWFFGGLAKMRGETRIAGRRVPDRYRRARRDAARRGRGQRRRHRLLEPAELLGPRPARVRGPRYAGAGPAELAGDDQRAGARLQSGPGAAARRRPPRPGRRLAGDGRPRARHAGRRPSGPGLRAAARGDRVWQHWPTASSRAACGR